MILISNDENNYFNGSVETSTVCGVLLASIALILVFLLYVNRKWCFSKKGFGCCNGIESTTTRYVHKITRRRHLENSSSDSDEEILRRLRAQNNANPKLANLSAYNSNGIYSGLKQIHNDPLGIAEKGKVGLPSSHSECSSNDSVEGSVTGILTGERKGIYKKSSADLIKETRIDNHSERNKFSKYQKIQTNQFSDKIESAEYNGNKDCIVNLSNDVNFDTSDLKSLKSDNGDGSIQSPILDKTCLIEISLLYDAPLRKMTVHVLQAKHIPSKENGQQTHSQIRLLMLPNKKQKHKTKIRSGENPQFIESFLLHKINPEEVNSMGLRVRCYGCERMRKERLIGEAIVSFATIDLELETNLSLPLEPRIKTASMGSTSDILSLARSDSTGSTISMQHGGIAELLLGLAYNGITGRLTVEIVKGSHFRSLNKAPDTYVKLCLVNSIGQEMARAKTSIRRGQPNPLFKETFVFQVALFQLNDVTLMISVYMKKNMKKNEMVGWFSCGLNSSGPEEISHWTDMRETKGEILSRWHILMDS